VGKPKGKRKLGRARPRWENNIKMQFREIGCQAVDWNDLTQQRDKRQDYANEAIKV
jgi:hypothetical protein